MSPESEAMLAITRQYNTRTSQPVLNMMGCYGVLCEMVMDGEEGVYEESTSLLFSVLLYCREFWQSSFEEVLADYDRERPSMPRPEFVLPTGAERYLRPTSTVCLLKALGKTASPKNCSPEETARFKRLLLTCMYWVWEWRRLYGVPHD